MKIKRGEREVWWGWEKRGWKLQTNFKNSKVRLFARKFRSIYLQAFTCRVGKILKERIRVVCCPWYGNGEQPEREVMKMAKVTTRGREGSPQAQLLCPCRRRDPQPESQETPKSLSSFSLVGSPFHW